MSNKIRGGVPKKLRRSAVIDRLQVQLKSNVKINNGISIPLTDNNIKRINKEILILKNRI